MENVEKTQRIPNVCITEPQRIYNGTPRDLCLYLGIEGVHEFRKLKKVGSRSGQCSVGSGQWAVTVGGQESQKDEVRKEKKVKCRRLSYSADIRAGVRLI